MRIICDEKKGLCIKLNSNEKNRSVTLSDTINVLLSNLMAVVVAQTTEENKESLYSMISLAFSNCLGSYAPELYYPDEEESEKFIKAINAIAADMPDNTEEIERAKELIKSRIVDRDATLVDLDLDENHEFIEGEAPAMSDEE